LGTVLKFILIFLGVGWLFGQLLRYFLRSKLAQLARRVNEAAMEQQRAQQQAQRPKEGVHVDFIPKKSAEKIKKDIEGGEYVDYEEVKD
jgi:anti-sigma28 factor (negative regulator of flagellin synthesis)